MEKDLKTSWNRYFINLAIEVGKKSTCKKNKVGSVIVKDKRIISTGYNGSPKGTLNKCECEDITYLTNVTQILHENATSV